jgi:threonine synthase
VTLSRGVGSESRQRCERCGHEVGERDSTPTCPACGGLLELVHGMEVSAAELKSRFASRSPLAVGSESSGVWRYRELVLPSATAHEIVSHPEGNTPLLERDAVSRWSLASSLLLKHEGHNPTGSFKDRGMTVAMTQARRVGARAVACASTGNTSASLASYAAHAALRALVFVPEGQVALGKLTQTLAYGATTLIVRGDFDRCLALARESATELGVYLVNSINPFRIEGQKTIGLELLQQLGWRAPDWIVLPAGNLGNTAAIGKAMLEAHAIGLIDRVPRIAAVQATGAAPFARAFADGFREHLTVRAETVATAIRIGAPASWDRAVRVIRETNGAVIAVSDEEILEAKAVIDAAGVGCEPASAASVAGVRRLVNEGAISRDARIVAILTGHVLKDPGILIRYHQETEPRPARANRPIEIEGTLSEVAAVIRG